jgi:RNA polymerase I-specific transcription initiation factor RRN7
MTPEVNAAPILWRVVSQCLGGSRMDRLMLFHLFISLLFLLAATLYRLTKRLASLLSLPLTLHSSLAPRLQRVKSWDPERHKYDNIAPELAFLATGMIVLKMVYGLDGKSRFLSILFSANILDR